MILFSGLTSKLNSKEAKIFLWVLLVSTCAYCLCWHKRLREIGDLIIFMHKGILGKV